MLQLEIHRGTVPLTGESEAYIRERANHLDAFYPRILTCRVTLEAPVNHHRQGGPFRVRIDLDVPGKVIVVNHRKAEDLHAAIRKAFEAAQRQLGQHASHQRAHTAPEPTPQRRGTVLRLFTTDGYGFLEAEDGREVYFHKDVVGDHGFGALEVGSTVEFTQEQSPEGIKATSVTQTA